MIYSQLNKALSAAITTGTICNPQELHAPAVGACNAERPLEIGTARCRPTLSVGDFACSTQADSPYLARKIILNVWAKNVKGIRFPRRCVPPTAVTNARKSSAAHPTEIHSHAIRQVLCATLPYLVAMRPHQRIPMRISRPPQVVCANATQSAAALFFLQDAVQPSRSWTGITAVRPIPPIRALVLQANPNRCACNRINSRPSFVSALKTEPAIEKLWWSLRYGSVLITRSSTSIRHLIQ
jgi:hypothetical protein